MPYTGPDDASLPEPVKEYPIDKRRHWVGAFNGSYETCRKRGQDDCEGRAFRIAYAAVKEVGLDGDNSLVCETGAISFEEFDALQVAQEKTKELEQAATLSEGLLRNIINRSDVEDKPKAIEGVMTGLIDRVKRLIGSSGKELKQTTKTEDGIKFRASDYAVVPDADKPSTWKLRLAEDRSGNFTVAQVARAITAMQPGGFRGQEVQLESGDKAQAVSRISAAIGKLDASDDQKDNLKKRLNKVKSSSFEVFKDKEGRWRWFSLVSNNFRDRDNPPEIIESKAHEEFVNYLDNGGKWPELWLWHTPGTKSGVADWAAFEHGFLMMSGTVDEGMENVAKALAEDEGLGVSHGFYSRPWDYDHKAKVIQKYRTFEVSPLPMECAANPWTSITMIRKEVSEMDQKKRAFIVEKLGEERTNQLIEHPKELAQELLKLGVESKEITELLTEEKPAEQPNTDDIAKAMVKELEGSEFFKNIQTTLADVKANADQVPGIVERIKALERTDDEKVAETLKAAAANASRTERATESEKNVVKKEDALAQAEPNTGWSKEAIAEALAPFVGAKAV